MKNSKLETINDLGAFTKMGSTKISQCKKLKLQEQHLKAGLPILLCSQELTKNNISSNIVNNLFGYFLRSILLFFLLFNANLALSNWGDSCVSVISPIESYMRENTAYGYLQHNIDMKYQNFPNDNVDKCDATDPQFKFCLNDEDPDSMNFSKVVCKTKIALNNGDSIKLSDLSKNPNLGGNIWLKDIVLTVKMIETYLCLTMPSSRGPIALACKSTTVITPVPINDDCRIIGTTCYMGTDKSQSLFNFSGLAVDCLKETLDKVFYRHTSCSPNSSTVSVTSLNPFPVFQESLKVAIRAGLIIYVILFGFNMLLNQDGGSLDKVAGSIFKIILVLYFAVGLGPVYFKDGKETTQNGMMEYGLPLLTEMTANFAQIVFIGGGSNGLCEFDIANYKKGYEFYALWDAVDCRIGYYLGMGLMYNTEQKIYGDVPSKPYGQSTGTLAIDTPPGAAAPEALSKVGSFRFFVVLLGFFMSGNFIIVISGLVFAVLFCSIILQFITSYLVCLITIYVMTYISPIFIPMALFTRTKCYFDAWLKICLSCALQPAVIAGFIALLLTLYDSAIYKNCQFVRHDYTFDDIKTKSTTKFSNFDLRIPKDNPDQCTSSAGYKLMHYYSGEGWTEKSVILFSIKSIVVDIVMLLVDLLYVFVFSIIFYFFSKSISQFAAEITGGPIMDSVTASPTKLVDMAIKAAEFISDALGGKNGKEGGGKGEPTDKSRKEGEKEGGGESKDSEGGAGKEGGGESKDSAVGSVSGGGAGGGG